MMKTILFLRVRSLCRLLAPKSSSIFFQKYALAAFLIISSVGVCGQTYNQISTIGELLDGEYLIVGDGSTNDGIMLNTTAATPYINHTVVTNPVTAITTGFTSANIFHVTVVSGVITIYNASVGYVSWGRSGNIGNNASFYNSSPTNNEKWTATVAAGLWTLSNVAAPTRLLQWNNVDPRFAAYTSAQVKLKLYKMSGTTVIFNSNYGTPMTLTQTASVATNLIVNTFTKTGYDFANWDIDSGGAGITTYEDGASFPFITDTTLYAQWVLNTTPTISITGSLSAVNTIYGTKSSNTTFSVSGNALTNDIIVTAPTGYLVSTNSNSGFESSVALTQTAGAVGATTVYVQIPETTAAGIYSGNIVLKSSGAALVNLATISSTVSKRILNVLGLSGVSKVYDGSTTATFSGTASLNEVLFADDVSLSGTSSSNFTDENVGIGKTINTTGYMLTGTKIGNYSLIQPTSTANITAQTLSISTPSISSKVYDGYLITGGVSVGSFSGLVLNETIAITGSGLYADANAGIGKTAIITYSLSNGTNGGLATNYSLANGIGTGDITKATPTYTATAISVSTNGIFALPGSINPTSDGIIIYTTANSTIATVNGTALTGGAIAGTTNLNITQAPSINYIAGSTTVVVNVTDVAVGSYETTALGNWTASIWRRMTNTGWDNNPGAPITGTTDKISIFHAVNFNTTGSWSLKSVFIGQNGIFTQSNSNGVTFTELKVLGIVNMDNLISINSSGNIELLDTSIFNANYSSKPYSLNLFIGNEIFHPNSNFILKNVSGGAFITTENGLGGLSAYTKGALSAYFGNLIIDSGGVDIDIATNGLQGNLTHGDFIMKTGGTIRFGTGASIGTSVNPVIIGGNLIMNPTFSKTLGLRNDTYNFYLKIKGDLINNSTGNFRFYGGVGTPTIEVSVDGNIKINSGNFYFMPSGNVSPVMTLNIKGDLSVATGAVFSNFNTNIGMAKVNFVGDSASVQNIDIGTISMTKNKSIDFSVISNSSVKLQNNSLELGTNSTFSINERSVFDFGFDGLTPLIITSAGSQTGQKFDAKSESTLKITSPFGITTIAAGAISGNVQVPIASRVFDPKAIYHYVGKTNQVTGNGLPDRLINKLIVELDTQNGTQDDLEFRSTRTTTFGTSNGVNGVLEIKKGKVIDEPSNGFRNYNGALDEGENDVQRGNIIMSGGRYVVSGSGTKPSLSGSYSFSAGAVEFAGLAATKIRTSIPAKQYYNVDVSGTQVETGGKNFVVNNLLKIISASAVLTIPEVIDVAVPYVVTAKKGIQVEAGGKAIFKNNAQLMQDIGAVNSGDITAERIAKLKFVSIATRADYNYWSSPVINQKLLYNSANMTVSFSPGTPNNRIFQYKESHDTFIGTNDPYFVAGKGYAIRAENSANGIFYTADGSEKTFQFLGIPNNGNITTESLLWSNVDHGYNLIGNPYPSNLNFDLFYSVNKILMYCTAYFWTNNTYQVSQGGSSYSGSNYAIYNATGGNRAAYQGVSAGPVPTASIKPGQGFIVQIKQITALNFSNIMRETAISPFFNNKITTEKDRFSLTLTTPSNINNVLLIGYVEGATNNFEKDYDAELLIESSDSFYSKLGTSKLAIQGRSYPFVDSDVVSLGAVYFESGLHKISLSSREGIFESAQNIYLKDNLLGQTIKLSTEDYTFSATKGIANDRFEIMYQPGLVLNVDEGKNNSIQVYRDGENFVVKSSGEIINEVEVYDLSGRMLETVKGDSSKMIVDGTILVSGIYILTIKSDKKTTSKRIIK